MSNDDLRLCHFAAEMPATPDWKLTATWCDLHPDLTVDLIAYTVERMLEANQPEPPPLPPEVQARFLTAWGMAKARSVSR